MVPRATPLAPDDRRDTLIAATLPLLLQHGRSVTTKQIADAAGVAEGTIFRVFDNKSDLLMAAVEQALDLDPFIADLGTIDPDLPLRERLIELVTRLQTRFRGVFALMTALGMTAPSKAHQHLREQRHRADRALLGIVEADADALTCTPDYLVHTLRLLTFSGTHPHISDGQTLTPEQIVATILDGVLRKESSC